MFSFFVPVSKVQKDRRVIRETDMRMAKYSRRGLIVNFIAFLVCLYGGQFLDENRELTIILTIGLLLATFFRGIYVFRFDHIYPHAPNKWRNHYFFATLVGAIWWSVIMCSITLVLEMKHEAPLFWLYTVVFFSTTAHAFAPYQKFLSVYQFLGQIPAAVAALILGTTQGYLYGGLLIVFYLVLNHQCRLMSENYWERLEVSYMLSRKAVSLEEEKKDTRASVRLNLEFLKYLVKDFEALVSRSTGKIHEEQNTLFKSIKRFERILNKNLKIKNSVFNIRHEIQSIVADYIDQAEKKSVLIETSLSPTLPMRLRGDPQRLGGIVQNLIEINLKKMQSGLLLIEAEFIREYEHAGELYITVTQICERQKGLFSRDKNAVLASEENLSYAVSQALAEIMEGSIEKLELPGREMSYRFNAKLDIADKAGQLDFHRNSFSGRTVLLVNANATLVDMKRQALEALGFALVTETQYERALTVLLDSAKRDKPIEAVVYYFEDEGKEALEFHKSISAHKELHFVKQIIAVSSLQKAKLARRFKSNVQPVFLLNKPMGLFELESTFHRVFADKNDEDTSLEFNSHPNKCKLYVTSDSEELLNTAVQTLKHKQLEIQVFKDVEQLLKALPENPDVILMDVADRKEARTAISKIRKVERENSIETLVPILGVTKESRETCTDYDMGIDDKVELDDTPNEVISLLHYWGTLH